MAKSQFGEVDLSNKAVKMLSIGCLIVVSMLSACTPNYVGGARCDSSVSGQYGMYHGGIIYDFYDMNETLIESKTFCRWANKKFEVTSKPIYLDEKGKIPSDLFGADIQGTINFNRVENHKEEVLECARLRYLTKEKELAINDSEENCLWYLALQYDHPAFCDLINMNPEVQSKCVATMNETTMKAYAGTDLDLYCYSTHYTTDHFMRTHLDMPSDHISIGVTDYYGNNYLGNQITPASWCAQFSKSSIEHSSDYIYVSGYWRERAYRPGCATCHGKQYVRGYYRRK